MASKKIGTGVAALLLAATLATAAPAAAKPTFHPRVHGAFGLIPRAGGPEIASGANQPVVYHGGGVMRDVTVHTIFWAPSGFQFDGAPGLLTLSYEAEIQRFLTDAAHDSGNTANVFSVLSQYGDGSGPGGYQLHYSAAADSINDADPFPARNKQCASPAGVETCVTDLQLQQEIDKQITAHDPGGRGLHDLWLIFLPPNVDQCISPGSCDSNSFAGYHGLSNLGHGPVIYASVPDPLIEAATPPGSDPQGNPEAENAIDTVAHETVEAITDPEGTGWMDPNGFEVGDDCENPELGTPLGYAINGSPYNQLINGHQYLIQMMWSNSVTGCVQRSTATTSALPLATVNIRQFSPQISGSTGIAKAGIRVDVGLLRASNVVAVASTRTNATGSWSTRLTGRSPHAFGDDRDAIVVEYGPGGPRPDVINTGSGGNPYTGSGWTGFFDLDNGYAVARHGVLLGPCSQTGVLGVTVGGRAVPSPVEQCETETGVSALNTGPINAGTSLTMSSQDNRGVSQDNPNGALVKLTIPLGEPDSAAALSNSDVLFGTTGFPQCLANLEAQSVLCSGLVPGARYTFTRRRHQMVMHARADAVGEARIGHAGVRGGDVIRLSNRSARTLTTLHVAHLRVRVTDQQTMLSGGSCQPGDYYGKPITTPPIGSLVGIGGATLTGTICPGNGRARGLPAGNIEQTDDLSGGLTKTELVGVASLTPNNGATLYGGFIASAQPALYGFNGAIYGARARVSLAVKRLGAKHGAVYVRNVAVSHGVKVGRLPRGVYAATWVVTNVNGDTVTVHTRFRRSLTPMASPKHGDEIPTGKVRRATSTTAALGPSSAKLAGSMITSMARSPERAREVLLNRHLELADAAVAVLGNLRGGAMKIGQLASFVDVDFLPPEYRAVYQERLAGLRDAAPAMGWEKVRRVLETELEQPVEESFAEISHEALAAASIGQVHRATLHDGRRVAVKVQYPEIADALAADLDVASVLIRLGKALAPGLDPEVVAGELRERVLEELDFELEAQNLRTFARAYRGHPFIFVPEVITALSRRRVMVCEWVDGIKFDDVVKLGAQERSRVGEIIVRFFFGSTHRIGRFNTDPHPGNYLLMEDGRMAFLDFGNTARVTGEWMELAGRVLRAAIDGNLDDFAQVMDGLGYVRNLERIDRELLFKQAVELLDWYLYDRELEIDPDYVAQVVAALVDPRALEGAFRLARQIKVPPEEIWLRRMETSVLAVLGHLRAKRNWHRIMREIDFGEEPATDLGRLEAEFWAARRA